MYKVLQFLNIHLQEFFHGNGHLEVEKDNWKEILLEVETSLQVMGIQSKFSVVLLHYHYCTTVQLLQD